MPDTGALADDPDLRLRRGEQTCPIRFSVIACIINS